MTLYRISIEARSPLAFPPRKPDAQFTPSLAYVPGGVIWGALGLARQATPAARFSHALPARAGDAWVRWLPATATSCKTHAGFLADSSTSTPNHGVFDTLFDRVCWEELRPAMFTYNPHCPECLGRVEPYTGFYALATDQQLHRRNVQRRVLTRVAIDRQRSTAAENLLYSPIVISEMSAFPAADRDELQYAPTRFLGQAWDLESDDLQHLEQISALGGRISSGLGQVRISVSVLDVRDDLSERIQAFQQTFQERWALFAQYLKPQRDPAWSPQQWQVFSVGLQSDAILHEQNWQPTMVFSAAQLQAETGLPAVLVRSQASAYVVGGWNVRWNRHRSTALAAQAGSVYLFRTQAPHAQVLQALRQLEAQGIGQRRAEGYGVVRCCDAFHQQATGAVL